MLLIERLTQIGTLNYFFSSLHLPTQFRLSQIVTRFNLVVSLLLGFKVKTKRRIHHVENLNFKWLGWLLTTTGH